MEKLWIYPLCAIAYLAVYTWHWLCYPFITRTRYTVAMSDLAVFPTMSTATKAVVRTLAKDPTNWRGKVKVSRVPTWQPDVWLWTFKIGITVVTIREEEQ